MKVIPFHPVHVRTMQHQNASILGVSFVTDAYTERLIHAGRALSAEADGRIIACAGIADAGFGVGVLWAFVADNTKLYFVRLDRAVRRFIASTTFRRIEASTPECFEQGCRWLELLGFEREGLMREYTPDGMNHWRYAKLRRL